MTDKDTVEREFCVLEEIKDNHPKYVISMDPILIKRSRVLINLMTFFECSFS